MTSAMRVRRWFCFSQMTVHDEAKRGQDYDDLKFVEFLEMLCRVAIERSQVRADQGDANEPMPLYHSVHDLITELQAKHDFLAEFEITPPDPAKEEQQLKDLEMLQ